MQGHTARAMRGISSTPIKDRGRRHAALAFLGVMVCAAVLVAAPLSAHAIDYTWSTFAGTGSSGFVDGPALSATFNMPMDVTVAPDGTVYVMDRMNNSVRKVSVGLGGWEVSTFKTAAGWSYPGLIDSDSDGNVWVPGGNARIFKVTPGGSVSTFANDGVAVNGVAVSIDGQHVYATDNHAVYEYDISDGARTLIAGFAGTAYEQDGTGAGARFNDPRGITCDDEGNVFVADYSGQTIRRIDHDTREVTTIGGFAQNVGSTDGPTGTSRFYYPTDLEWDAASGDLVVVDQANGGLRRLSPEEGTWQATTICPHGTWVNPFGISIAGDGSLYVAVGSQNIVVRGEIVEPPSYTLTFAAGPGGSVEGSLTQSVHESDDASAVAAVPDRGYRFVDWTIQWSEITDSLAAGVGPITENPLTLLGVTNGASITANFELGPVTGLASSTHPDDEVWYSNSYPRMEWDVAAGAGASYVFDQAVDTVPDAIADAVTTSGLLGAARTYPAGNGAQSVASADFDGDGDADLVAATTYDGTVSIHLNDGYGGFATGDPAFYPVGSYPRDVVCADFDDDGNADIAVANSGGSTVSILLGNGDGTFDAAVDYSPGMTPFDLATGDFDDDGWVDLAVVSSGDTAFAVMVNDDGAGFTSTRWTTSETYVQEGITVADFDCDGLDDVAVPYNGGVIIAYNDGGATFPESGMTYCGVGGYAYDLAAADFDSDGRPDIFAPDGNGSVKVLWNDADNGFSAFDYWSNNTISCCSYGGTAGDINGDGNPDLIDVNEDYYTTSVWLGDGTGGFASRQDFGAYSAGYGVTAADLDGNGSDDIATGGSDGLSVLLGGVRQGCQSDYLADGRWYFHVRYVGVEAAGFSAQFLDPGSSLIATRAVLIDTTAPTVVLSGAEDDGAYLPANAPEAVLTATDPNMPDASGVSELSWYDPLIDDWTTVDGNTASFDLPSEPGVYEYAYQALDEAGNYSYTQYFVVTIVGDITNLSSPTHPDDEVWYSNNMPAFAWDVMSTGGYSCELDQTADTVPDTSSDPVLSSGLLTDRTLYPVGGEPAMLCSGDFNEDGAPDLASSNHYSNTFTVQLNDGEGVFQGVYEEPVEPSGISAASEETSYTSYPTGYGPMGIATADFDDDGHLDVAVANYDDGTISLFLGNGDGTFEPAGTFDTIAHPTSVAAGDLAPAAAQQGAAGVVVGSDGLPDLAVSTYDDYECDDDHSEFATMINDGEGGFSSSDRFEDYDLWQMDDDGTGGIAIADMDLDGSLDVVLSIHNGVSIQHNDGGGEFSERQAVYTTAYPEAVAVGDLNGDSYPDIVLPDESDGDLSVLFSDEGGFSTDDELTLEQINCCSYGAAVGDINGDGKPDIIDCNEDDNTVSVWLGDGVGGFGARHDFDARSTGYNVISKDFNHDGRDDVATVAEGADYGIRKGPSEDPISVLLSGSPSNVTCGPVADGVWYFHVRPVGGGEGGETASMRVNVDTTAPTTELTGVVDGETYGADREATVHATDGLSGVAHVEWRAEGGEWTRTDGDTAAIDISAAVEGTYRFGYRATDEASNTSDPTTFTVTMETGRAFDDVATSYSRPALIEPLSNDDAGIGTIASLQQPLHGAVTTDSATVVRYTPVAGYLGADSFKYTTTGGKTATVTVTVEPNVSAPRNVAAAKVTTHSVDVTWGAPDSFGSGFASYVVAWRSHGTVDWNLCTPITAAGTMRQAIADERLAPGVTYDFKVSVTDTGSFSASSTVAFLLLGGADEVIPPVTTRSGVSATLTVDGVDEGALLELDPDADDIPGVGSISVSGLSIRVVPDPSFTGLITVPVTVTQDGASTVVDALLTVNPADPTGAYYGVISNTQTRLAWVGSAGATGYRIYVGGILEATVGPESGSYTIPRFLGPNAGITVQATGNEGTASNQVPAAYRSTGKVKVALVSFTGNSAKLSKKAKSTLRALARVLVAQGFTSATVDGFCGRKYPGSLRFRKRLSAARAAAVKAYLATQFKKLHVKVSLKTVGWGAPHSASLSARFRRAEVVLK